MSDSARPNLRRAAKAPRRRLAPARGEHRAQARFRHLIELSHDWYWEQDERFRFTFLSNEVGEKSGISQASHLGRARWELPALNLGEADWARHRATLERHEPFDDFVMRRPDANGREHWVSVTGRPVFDAAGRFRGYWGVGHDITGRMQAETALRESEARFRALTQLSSDFFWETDTEYRFRHIAGPILAAVGVRPEDFIGRDALDLPHYTLLEPSLEAFRALRERREGYRDVVGRVALPGGEVRYVSVSGEPVHDANGVFKGYRGISRDITRQRMQAEQIRALNEQLERRVAERTSELEALVRELEAFSYSVSHDLRAPLRAIGSFARMVVEDEGAKLSDEGRRQLAVVESNARRMGQLVDDLLQLARVNRAELRLGPVDMRALCLAVAQEMGAAHPGAVIEVGPMPPAQGDPTLVRQVVENLVGNALKYSGRAAAPRVELGWSEARRAWWVRDNGVGFDMAYAGKLFQPFQRLHAPSDFHGTGIGLAIVKRVVERHGGKVRAEGSPGAGALFSFTLGG